MHDDTQIGGQKQRFPTTRRSAVLAARSPDATVRRRAWETLAAAYWKPVYKYIRVRWNKSNEDAKDLTQEFLARAMEKGFLDSYDPARARLRTFLRVCVDRFVANQDQAAERLKRGGAIAALDFDAAEAELARIAGGHAVVPEEFFDREWARAVFGIAVNRLKNECHTRGRELHFLLFQRRDLDDGERRSYDELARDFGLKTTDVTNHLAATRREFRRILLETLREMTASDAEFRREARALLGVDPP
jgi:RNA polymerase sigma factor (sigma-70 family)